MQQTGIEFAFNIPDNKHCYTYAIQYRMLNHLLSTLITIKRWIRLTPPIY